MSFVLDTSITLAWCFEDEQTAPIMALLDRLVEHGAHAPSLWPIESLNGLLTAERRGRIAQAVRERLAGFLRDLPIAIDGETAARIWSDTALLAARHRLTATDAAYLELALRRRVPLATTDRALADAARAEAVSVLP